MRMPPRSSPAEWISATIPKTGNRPEENEDAIAVAPDGLRFAVADGASEGWESGPWAGRLAGAFVRRPPTPADFPVWLAEARRNWAPSAAPAADAPWYASVKREQGSFATLAGLELRRPRRAGGWAWRAVAVGDSCLIHIRGTEVETAFPLAAPKAFGNRPALVPSSADAGCPDPEWLAGRAEAGDLLLLATDAAAARLLDPPARGPALGAVRASLRARAAEPLVDWFRELQTTANDDVSVIAIRLTDRPEAS